MAILGFLGRVNIAVHMVPKQYSDAKLLEVDGLSSNGAATSATDIDQLRVVFQNVDNTTVMINSTGWGQFGAPELIEQPWVGDVVINWPDDVKIDLDEAIALKDKAGFDKPFNSVTLRNPLGPVRTNTFYIFGFDDEAFVFVDAVTGEVHSGN